MLCVTLSQLLIPLHKAASSNCEHQLQCLLWPLEVTVLDALFESMSMVEDTTHSPVFFTILLLCWRTVVVPCFYHVCLVTAVLFQGPTAV